MTVQMTRKMQINLLTQPKKLIQKNMTSTQHKHHKLKHFHIVMF